MLELSFYNLPRKKDIQRIVFSKCDANGYIPNSWELDTSSNAATSTTARNA
jgi:hypothetical protein